MFRINRILRYSTIARGDFTFIQDKHRRTMLKEAWVAVEKADAWHDLKSIDVPGEDGFMFSKHPAVKRISEALVDTIGHSGGSWGWTMRRMEYIAKNGWDNFVELQNSNNINNNDERINSLESRVFILEDEVQALKVKLAVLS